MATSKKRPNRKRPARAKMSKGEERFYGFIALGIVAGIIYWIVSSLIGVLDSDSFRQSGERSKARRNCMNAVEARAKNPSSVDFALLSITSKKEANGWHIHGPVSMKNDFGHRVEMYFFCRISGTTVYSIRLIRR